LRILNASGCSGLTGKCFNAQTFPSIENLCLHDCDGLSDFSSLSSLKTLQVLDLSCCDFSTKAALSALSFVPSLDTYGCYGVTQDKETSGKVEQQQAENPNKPTEELIEAMRQFVEPPDVSQPFCISKRDASTISLMTFTRRRLLGISWTDIDWKHVSWYFGSLRPRWPIFLMDDASIQVDARPVWP
jgi:hypothetical protein